MSLFKIQNNNLVLRINKNTFDLEKNLQMLFEKNLEEILNITFLAHEYSTSFGGRIDTLGLDKNGSPVIIEFKKNQNDNVINQGLSYLKWLLDHKADFEKLLNAKLPGLKNMLIDWSSPRMICVAENYNKFDLDTADFLPIRIELFRYTIYEGNILHLEAESYQKNKYSNFKKTKNIKEKRYLQKTYSINDHLKKANKEIKQLFLLLREKIMSIDEKITEESKAKYIAYKTSTNFVDVTILHDSLKIFLNVKSGQLKDPYNLARDLTKPKSIGHWGNGDYELRVKRGASLEKVFNLIIQSYNLNK